MQAEESSELGVGELTGISRLEDGLVSRGETLDVGVEGHTLRATLHPGHLAQVVIVGKPARHATCKIRAAQVDLRIQAFPDRRKTNTGAHEVFVAADGARPHFTELAKDPVRRQP